MLEFEGLLAEAETIRARLAEALESAASSGNAPGDLHPHTLQAFRTQCSDCAEFEKCIDFVIFHLPGI
jgi:hypothetical protein